MMVGVAGGDTAPIRPEEDFDHEEVAAYLSEHVPGFTGGASIRFDQFPGGAANLTYRAVAGETELVLRRAPLGVVAPGSHDMSREYRVLARLWRFYPLAPRAYHYCEDQTVMGKPFLVMERRRGYVVRDQWPRGWVEDDRRRTVLATSLALGLADLHSVTPGEAGLSGLGRPDGFVARQVEGWRSRWEAAKTRELPDIDLSAEILASAIPEPQTATILHNDYKLDNTMADDDGNLTAVLDWDMATVGDPLVDLGTLVAYWPDPESPTYPVLGEQAVALGPVLSKSEAVRIYAERTGFSVDLLEYYEALALYRIAIIIEQIYARFARGQTSDPRFARFEPIAAVLGAAARKVLEG